MTSRRAYLAAAGGLFVSTAGCTSVDWTWDITVTDVGVRKAAAYESETGSGGVVAADGTQYVVARIRHDGNVSPSAVTLEAGGDSWDHGLSDTEGGVNVCVAGREGFPFGYLAAAADEWSHLAFAVPSPLSASAPRIRYSGLRTVEWPLGAACRERLAAPAPRFELLDLSVPYEVWGNGPLGVTFEVRNVSAVAGRFLAAVYWPTRGVADDDESRVLEAYVPADDRETFAEYIRTRGTADENTTVELRVEGHVSARRSIYYRPRR